jgi:hypothetical protein
VPDDAVAHVRRRTAESREEFRLACAGIPGGPPVTFFLQQGNVCMGQDDADQFGKWLDELDAFSAGRDRLLKD